MVSPSSGAIPMEKKEYLHLIVDVLGELQHEKLSTYPEEIHGEIEKKLDGLNVPILNIQLSLLNLVAEKTIVKAPSGQMKFLFHGNDSAFACIIRREILDAIRDLQVKKLPRFEDIEETVTKRCSFVTPSYMKLMMENLSALINEGSVEYMKGLFFIRSSNLLLPIDFYMEVVQRVMLESNETKLSGPDIIQLILDNFMVEEVEKATKLIEAAIVLLVELELLSSDNNFRLNLNDVARLEPCLESIFGEVIDVVFQAIQPDITVQEQRKLALIRVRGGVQNPGNSPANRYHNVEYPGKGFPIQKGSRKYPLYFESVREIMQRKKTPMWWEEIDLHVISFNRDLPLRHEEIFPRMLHTMVKLEKIVRKPEGTYALQI